MGLEESLMMATANFEVPVDLLGRKLTLNDVKDMLRRDVEELAAAHDLLEQDCAKRRELGSHSKNRRLLNVVSLWETAHDLHWAWYGEMVNDAAT
jgi:hypothetical protein